jgi:hypothetical protein
MVSFAVLCLVAIGFVYRFLPETKELSVEQTVSVFERQATGAGTAPPSRLAGRPGPPKTQPG